MFSVKCSERGKICAKTVYNPLDMALYWQDTEIKPGMLLEVDEHNYEVRNRHGRRARVVWKILALESKQRDEAYYETDTGKQFTMKKVMKNRKLAAKLQTGTLIQIPACTDFLVVQEFHDGSAALLRCYSLDMLGNIRDFRIVESV